MAKKRVIRIDRLIIVILSGILLFGLIGLGIYSLWNLIFNNANNEKNNIDNVETIEGINISLVDYDIYLDETDKFDFNFIVAKLKFTGKDKISFNLNDLQTSEKTLLGNVDKNIDELEAKGYKISKLDVISNIESDQKELTCNIFIPFKTNNNSLQVYNINDPSISLMFDLTKEPKYFTSLKFDTNQDIVVNNTKVSVSKCSVSTLMIHNGQEYNLSSQRKVFTFKIYVSEIEDNVYIEDAYFIKENTDEKIACMSEEYSSEKIDNILNKKLTVGENDALFFETYAPEQKPDYSGVLMIKFSNSNDWVEVPTNLE